MNKSSKKKSNVKKITQFEIIRPHVAGIDISDNAGMMVAYPLNEHEIAVEEFECYTCDLRRISSRLKEYKIESVAMEATGVYWIPLFLLLQEDGFEVYLVNSKHAKNVTGRKYDEEDAEWIQKLHRCGLLSASFQPDNQTRSLRSVVRHRSSIVATRSCYLNRMQKALEQMNIKLHTVISDIDGKTGLSILHAIFEGERDAEKLADLCDSRIKASRKDVVKSLEGFWSQTHLFELRQCYKAFQFHNDMIDECDREIEKILLEIIAGKNYGVIPDIENVKRKRNCKRQIQINVTAYLKEINGIDITEITGISEISAMTILSEVGTDMSKWKTAKHFTSWLGLAPNTKISGGKVISSRVPKKKHYAGQAFRMAAMSLRNNQGPLGDFYRRIRIYAGAPKAIVAVARKLAVIYYQMMTSQQAYNPVELVKSQEKYKEQKIKQLERKIEKLKNAS
jgi:transposase